VDTLKDLKGRIDLDLMTLVRLVQRKDLVLTLENGDEMDVVLVDTHGTSALRGPLRSAQN